MRLQIEGKLFVGIISVSLIATAVAALGVASTRHLVRDGRHVSETHELRVTLRELSRRIDAGEGDLRGYLLTGDSLYVRLHKANVAAARIELERASSLAGTDTAQRDRLSAARRLVSMSEAAFDSSVRLGVGERRASSSARDGLRLNETLTARIDSLIASADSAGGRLLRLQLGEQSRSELMLTMTSAAAVIALVALAIAFARSIRRDITARRRREAHEHALAVAGDRLALTTAYDETLKAVAGLPVPRFGDWAVLHVVEENDGGETTLKGVPSHIGDDVRSKALAEYSARPVDLDSAVIAVDILRTGDLRSLTRVTDDWIEAHADDPRHAELSRLLGMRSLLLVPLIARERVLGVWTIGSSGTTSLDRDGESLVRALASRAALAIENALALQRAQRAAAARDNVLGVVSHDLRNPLSAVSMLSRRLLDDELSSEEQHAVGSQILTSVDWMHRLMQDLLDVSSIEAGKLSVEPEDQLIDQIIHAAVEMFAARAVAQGIMLRREVPPDLPRVFADAERIIQVLVNLLGNALKFTPSGGIVSVGARAQVDEVRVWVRDTGVGIPPADIPHVFDRFWHASRNGSSRGAGLGLAIAHGIIRAHGGRLWLESVTGRGTSFYFSLPAVASKTNTRPVVRDFWAAHVP